MDRSTAPARPEGPAADAEVVSARRSPDLHGPGLRAATVAALRELTVIEPLARSNPDAADDRAAVVQHGPGTAGRPDLALRAQLVRAEVACRRGRLEDGGRTARSALRWAVDSGDRYVQARSHLVLDLFFASLGENALALEHALLAVQHLDEDVPERLRLDAQLRLAGAIGMSGDRAGARVRYAVVIDAAEALGETAMLEVALNNTAWNECQDGFPSRALPLLDRIVGLRTPTGRPVHPSFVDTLARVLIRLGRYAEAESAVESLAPSAGPADGDPSGRAQCLLALAECRRRAGRLSAAQEALDACAALCGSADLPVVRAEAHAEQAEVHAAGGRFAEAFAEHKAFHAQTVAGLSRERDARARTLQVVFEADEARRESHRYRELALRDPLTRLRNRRYMDQTLPGLLRRCVAVDRPAVVALLDLDRFKRVNDTVGHGVGDVVLQRAARLLGDALPELPVGDVAVGDDTVAEDAVAPFVARIGGEEFLVVLPDTTVVRAREVLERMRRTVAGHPWGQLTGGVPVTISGGAVLVSPQGPPLTATDVLARADLRLHEAKSSGRDRVVADWPRGGPAVP